MAKREWDNEIFKRYRVVASPSQLVDYLDCPRKWWFRRVHQIKVHEEAKKFVFGNALHAILQRYLEADDTGRAPDGSQVDLYPKGWDEGLSRKDAQLVTMLANKMIEQGIVRRTPNRLVEVEFEKEIIPGVGLIGALDVGTDEGVEDHKSTKKRDYAVKEKDLGKEPKMMSYAQVWFDNYPDDVCTLRLNYATKNEKKPEVWPVSAMVSREDALRFWEETIVPAAEGMLRLKAEKAPLDDWRKITGPCAKDACSRYGGCPYARICGRMTTPARLKAELDLQKKQPTTPTPLEKKPMSIFGKKPKSPVTVTKLPPEEDEVLATEAPEEVEEAVEEAVTDNLPPWHSPGCLACKEHPGLNSKGDPCKACGIRSAREGRPTSDKFNWGLDSDGNLFWSPKEASAAPPGKTQVTPPVKAPKTPAAGKPHKAAVEPVAPPEPVVEAEETQEAEETEEVAQEAPVAPKRGRGRPRKTAPSESQKEALAPEMGQESPAGFELFINALPAQESYVDLVEVMHNEGAELAAALGAENYYMVDAFKRRDFLASKVADVARELEGQTVVALGGGQDLKVYLEALRPYARRVVLGVF